MISKRRFADQIRAARLLLGVCASLAVAACASGATMEMGSTQMLSAEVRSVLGASRPNAEYHRARSRLLQMGPEVDVILVGLVGDTRARTAARADALILLADRQSPLALPTLASALKFPQEALRSAAVVGLHRIAPTRPEAIELIKGATTDRSRTVRLNALQSLNVREVETIRQVLLLENDPEVRQVGLQLILLAEYRGAPLAADSRGALRTGTGDGTQIVFRPVSLTAPGVARGDLRLELAERPDIPLAPSAIVVDNVVPAFFSPDRANVVVEVDGQIQVIDLSSGAVRQYGDGIAPRPIPFTFQFVFLRERVTRPTSGPRREIVYDVYRAPFGEGAAERIGGISAWANDDVHGGESPVRWMVVDEGVDGFVLRGDNMDTFPLPTPVWAPGGPSGP
jgi:hypothetical protein